MNNKETLFYNKSKINIKDLKLFSYQDIKECQFSKEQLDDCIEKLKRINELFQYKFDIKQLSA
jgi:hypothetical protein